MWSQMHRHQCTVLITWQDAGFLTTDFSSQEIYNKQLQYSNLMALCKLMRKWILINTMNEKFTKAQKLWKRIAGKFGAKILISEIKARIENLHKRISRRKISNSRINLAQKMKQNRWRKPTELIEHAYVNYVLHYELCTMNYEVWTLVQEFHKVRSMVNHESPSLGNS